MKDKTEWSLCSYERCKSPFRDECAETSKAACDCECHDEYGEDENDGAAEELDAFLTEQATPPLVTGAKLRVYAPNPPEQARLNDIKKESEIYLTPTIRVLDIDGDVYALEGSHRLAAASDLGKGLILRYLNLDKPFPSDIELFQKDGTPITGPMNSDVVFFLHKEVPYEFDEALLKISQDDGEM